MAQGMFAPREKADLAKTSAFELSECRRRIIFIPRYRSEMRLVTFW
jgi:hypothetical protein